MLSKEIFNDYMEILCEVYQRKSTKLLLKAYYIALMDMSDKRFERATELVLKNRIYNTFPLPAEILHAIRFDEE